MPPGVLVSKKRDLLSTIMPFDNPQRRRIVQVFCGPQHQIRIIVKNTKRRVAPLAQHPPDIVRIMAMIHRKLILLKL
jgi:hypothetical protein